ncbi:MAG: glycosyltransferase, partial [Promethearchaeota archaeon]
MNQFFFIFISILILELITAVIINLKDLKVISKNLNSYQKSIMYSETKIPVSIIIPAWNEAKTVENCIKAIYNSYYQNFEIIVVAGGTDETYDLVNLLTSQYENLKLIKQQYGGKNLAILDGIEKATKNVIVLLDADCIVDKFWLKNLISPFCSDNIILTSGFCFPRRKINWINSYFIMNQLYSLK